MLPKETFHSLRLAHFCPQRAVLAPDRARRAMVFSYGESRLQAMAEHEQKEIYDALLAQELDETPRSTGTSYLECPMDAQNEDGLALGYAQGLPDQLIRMVVDFNSDAPGALPMGGIYHDLRPSDPAQRQYYSHVLQQAGFPLPGNSAWSLCQQHLEQIFEAWTVQKPNLYEGKSHRLVHGLTQGLYYQLTYHDEKLGHLTITDAALFRDAYVRRKRKAMEEYHELKAPELADEAESSMRTAMALDVSSLEDYMEFLYDLPEASRLESSSPALTKYALPFADVDHNATTPHWLKRLSPEQEAELQQFLFNTDAYIMGELMERVNTVSSMEELVQMRDELIQDPAMQKAIARSHANSLHMNDLWSGLEEPITGYSPRPSKRVDRLIYHHIQEALRGHFSIPWTTPLADTTLLRQDLRASDDDLHLIRVALNTVLHINFKTHHWEGVTNLDDLAHRVSMLQSTPDHSAREPIPSSAVDRMQELQNLCLARVSDSFRESYQATRTRFQKEVEAYEFSFAALG